MVSVRCTVRGVFRYSDRIALELSQRPWIVPVVAGASVFIAGFAIFFIVWAHADGIEHAMWAKLLWPIVSFPLFSLTPKGFSTLYFWELAILNNFLWALAVASNRFFSEDI
jgi:hypothetical protein